MARTKRNPPASQPAPAIWRAALYMRLSREDGDKPESDSIANQRALLESFAAQQPDMQVVGQYSDDGYTGTNFQRPDFQRMIADIGAGKINCVIVKDLSRFGRDYVNTGYYLERWFPEHGVRFLSVGDHIDSEKGPYDMMLPFKNVFNEQYARDISQKVRSAMQVKQRQGAFIGAFASYGYQKDPEDHNKLQIDPCAAAVVQRIFDLFEQGNGKVKIAKLLNREGIPCPSEYKKLNGERYHNGQKLGKTTYWTYATIHRMLGNQMYIGNMEQGRAPRSTMHGKARQLDRAQWTIVEGTHEPIITRQQWDRVQALLRKDTRSPGFEQNISPFAGFLHCGDCGRAMCKTKHPGGIYYSCGSYKRYGPTACTRHGISQQELERIILEDLNKIIAAVGDLKALAKSAAPEKKRRDLQAQRIRIEENLNRLYHLKKGIYEDYRSGLLTKTEYLRYKEDYTRQEEALETQRTQLEQEPEDPLERPWIDALLQHGRLTELDRTTIAETVKDIQVFDDGHIEITYLFSDELGILNDPDETG